MSTATIIPIAESPLTQAHREALAVARERAKKIRKSAGVAAFNGWATAIFAALSMPFAFFSVTGFLVAAGLTIVAFNEFRGRKRLLAFDPAAATMLGWNQLGFLAMIVAYCVWTLYADFSNGGAAAAELKAYADLEVALGAKSDMGALFQTIELAVYGLVIVLSVVFQGANAIYYFTRRKYVEAYVRETPEWVRELQSATHSN